MPSVHCQSFQAPSNHVGSCPQVYRKIIQHHHLPFKVLNQEPPPPFWFLCPCLSPRFGHTRHLLPHQTGPCFQVHGEPAARNALSPPHSPMFFSSFYTQLKCHHLCKSSPGVLSQKWFHMSMKSPSPVLAHHLARTTLCIPPSFVFLSCSGGGGLQSTISTFTFVKMPVRHLQYPPQPS